MSRLSSRPVSRPQGRPGTRPAFGRGRPLWWQLLRIGWSAGRGAPGDRLRFTALLAASSAVALFAMAVFATVAVYAGRDARTQVRGPVYALSERPASRRPAIALVKSKFDAVGGLQHQVVFVEPLSASAPPPAGLPRWPRPGEAYLSPELKRVGAGEGITSRYGRYAGLIGASGLASPAERYAYVRPPAGGLGLRDTWYEVTGFDGPGVLGESLYVWPLTQFLVTLGGLAGLPVMALLVIAARVGSATRDRRASLLQALGGGWSQRALMNVGEAAIPAGIGTVAGVASALVAMSHDLRVPVSGYLLSSEYLRAGAWMVPIAGFLSLCVVLGVVVLVNRVAGGGRQTRPRGFAEEVPRWRLVVFGCMVGGVVVSDYFGGTSGLIVFVVGTVGMWATLPSVAAVASRRFGLWAARRGRRRGSPVALVAGRWTVAHPGVTVRLAVAVVIGLGLVSQIQTWVSRLGEQAAAAEDTRARIGDSLLYVESASFTQGRVDDFVRMLPATARILTLRAPSGGRPVLSAPCPVLRDLRLDCPAAPTVPARSVADRRVQELLRWGWGGDELRVVSESAGPGSKVSVPAPAGPEETTLIVLLEGHPPVSKARIEQAAYATLPQPDVSAAGESWLTAASTRARLATWIVLFGGCGLFFLLIAAGFAAAAEFLRFGPALAPLTAQTDRRGVFTAVAWWSLTLPMMIAAIVGGTIAAWHGLLFIATVKEGSFSWTVIGVATAGACLLAVIVGLAAGVSAARTARRWRPVAD